MDRLAARFAEAAFMDKQQQFYDEFKGPCRSRRELKRVIAKMKEKRSEVFNFIVRFPFLNSEIKTRIMNDLNVFYLTIEDRKLIREEFMDDCN